MAKGYIAVSGGGGSGSDECTASRANVLEGTTAITSDSGDEPAEGTMPDKRNLDPTIGGISDTYPEVAIHKGTAPQINTSTKSKEALFGIRAQEGYYGHTYIGVTLPDLRKVIGYTDASKVVKGTTIAGLAGTLQVNSVVSFSVAAYSTSQVTATWKWPSKGPYGGVIIRYKTGGYPTSVTDGTQGYKGTGSNSALNSSSSAVISGLTAGTTYYFRIWLYCDTSTGTWYSGYMQATATPTNHGSIVLTGTGTWTVPNGVRTLTKGFLAGGGAGGSGGDKGDKPVRGGNGGGSGYVTNFTNMSVTPGQKIAYACGAGGAAGGNAGRGGGAGGNTTFGTYSAKGADLNNYSYSGGKGGSGGGGGTEGWENERVHNGGTGGSNGGNGGTGGGPSGGLPGGKGAGVSTKGPNGVLYCGGGGGGANSSSSGKGGAGGSGGGGKGGSGRSSDGYSGTAGTANTGSGGGGGGVSGSASSYAGGAGGSGVIVIQW